MRKIYRVKSALSGFDYYDKSGALIGYSVTGIGGGEDFYGVNGETGYTVDSALGGQDYYQHFYSSSVALDILIRSCAAGDR